jgi:hypothetical protein
VVGVVFLGGQQHGLLLRPLDLVHVDVAVGDA